MNQSYPWMKLPHRQYLVSITYAALNPIERLAFLELAMYAHTQANNQLPDNDAALAGWSGMAIKKWIKVKSTVFSEWLLKDGFWSLPKWFVIESIPEHDSTLTEQTQDDISAKRSAAANARWNAKRANAMQNDDANNANDNFASCKTDANTMQNTNLHDAKVMQNDANDNFAYANAMQMGGRGEDLDLEPNKDLELKQELNTSLSKNASAKKENGSIKLFDDDLKPDLKTINDKFIGEIVVTQEFIDSELFLFNSHYETQALTENQRLAKWVSWIRRKKADAQIAASRAQKITRSTNNKVFGNVNDDFPVAPQVMLSAEEIAANKEKLNDLPF